MDIVAGNLDWITENIALASLGVVFGWTFLYIRQKLVRWLLFILWMLFLPNTIYLVTDIEYLPAQFTEVNLLAQIVLLVQYVVVFSLGIASFLLALYPLEKTLSKLKKNQLLVAGVFVVLNFLMAFAVALGKFQRVESWHVLTQPQQVIASIEVLLSSPDILVMIFLFGVFCNLTYFPLRKAFKPGKL